MKKLIALGVSIVILITAFVLLPKQKNEEVIAGPGSKKDEKIESPAELHDALISVAGYDGSVEKGTYTLSYDIVYDSDYGYQSGKGTTMVYLAEGIEYCKLNGSYVTRVEDDDDNDVLTVVFDIELYAEDDEMAVRFNFFDGYSNTKIEPALPVDQIGVWFEVDEGNYYSIKNFFGGYFVEVVDEAIMNNRLTSDDDDVYVYDSSKNKTPGDYSDRYEYEYVSVDLSEATKPVCEYHSDRSFNAGDRYEYIDMTLTMSNINNIEIEFDLDDVALKKEKALDWDIIEDIIDF